jgi:hypothetical protein
MAECSSQTGCNPISYAGGSLFKSQTEIDTRKSFVVFLSVLRKFRGGTTDWVTNASFTSLPVHCSLINIRLNLTFYELQQTVLNIPVTSK